MLTKIDDKTIRTLDEIEKMYPDNFILFKETADEEGYVVGLCTGSEVILAEYATMLFEEMQPRPKFNPFAIAYGANIGSSIGGVYLEI